MFVSGWKYDIVTRVTPLPSPVALRTISRRGSKKKLKQKEHHLKICSLKHPVTIVVLCPLSSLLDEFQIIVIKNFCVDSIKSGL